MPLVSKFKRRTPISLLLVMSLLNLTLAACASDGPFGAADPWPALSRKVDAAFAPADRPDGPGCAVGVILEGRYIHKAGYGMANLEHGVPIATDSVFRVGSVSKQFTAMAVALAAEEGKLDLDADVRDFVTELPDYGRPVTLRQLIGHVGGMGGYSDLRDQVTNAVEGPFRFGNQDYLTTQEFLEVLTRVPLVHAPDTGFAYSNLGYFLLSQVVERATGQTLRRYAQARIFDPLGMDQSFFNDNVNGVVARRASGYKKVAEGRYEAFDTNLDWVGDGGLYTSIEDFLEWDRNFYAPRLGRDPKAIVDLTTAPVFPEAGPSDDQAYGFGQTIGTLEGEPMISHAGEWVAFTAYYMRFPRQAFSIVTFCNGSDLNAYDLSRAVLDVYWETRRSGPPPVGQ